MQNTPDISTLVGFGLVFTLLFVMLGPVKILGPFVKLTRDMDLSAMKKTAVLSFVLAVIAVLFGGFLGCALLANWQISIPALYLAGGIIFALVGLRLVLEQYEAAPATPPPPPSLPVAPLAAAMRITFPTIVTPYGIATLIIMLANSPDASRTLVILMILLGVMTLNLLAMLFARWIMRGLFIIALQILGAVLGVLQVALAIEMMLRTLRSLGALDG
jgi:multiple antibiotic resistance protein